MQWTKLAIPVYPKHRIYGYKAPAVMINAENFEEAAKIAVKQNHLLKNYDVWMPSR